MKFLYRNRLFRRPWSSDWELGRKTVEKLEGPAGDFAKVASTVPS